jgi:hypothetical protein
MNVIARVTAITIDPTASEPQLIISADLIDSATGLVLRKVKGRPENLSQAHKDRIAAMIVQAQAWADARLAEALGT